MAPCVDVTMHRAASRLWMTATRVAIAPDHAKESKIVSASTGEQRRPANRLAQETSPYLLQHARNPVDWYPWGDEALTRAKAANKPIFLSIGYSACHWCHVMERESFEDEAIAALLNQHFVSIKVDREERPDLDAIYMTAVQLMTGSGGWPMTVFLTPDLKPFYGGTYFPPADVYGRPGLATVLKNVAGAWEQRNSEILRNADQLTTAIQGHMTDPTGPGGPSTPDLLNQAVQELRASFDPVEGGFGPAPKFPPTGAIAFLLRQYLRTRDPELLTMATLTLDKMAWGGLYDQLGGGFHRYATDGRWLVPHFEKMLYDNALLAQVYLEAYQLTHKPLYARVAAETLDYVLRDMTDEAGGFHSSEDADSEGREGTFYLWSHDEIAAALGPENGRVFCAHYGVTKPGNFPSHEPYHAGQNILHVPRSPEALAGDLHITTESLERGLYTLRTRLLTARNRRVRPGRDDKVLTAWNALMISALARGYQVLEDPRYKEAAARAANFLLGYMTQEGALLRTYRNGESRVPGYLDDYAFTVVALLDLYEATFELRWVSLAQVFARKMVAMFWDNSSVSFDLAAAVHGNLIARPKTARDGAEPSGNSMAAVGLSRLARMTSAAHYDRQVRRMLEANSAAVSRMPQSFLRMLCAADWLLYPPKEVAIVGKRGSEEVAGLLRVLHRHFVPDKMVAFLDPSDPEAASITEHRPLLKDKTMVTGKATAYVCKDFVCGLPLTSPEDLLKALEIRSPGGAC